MKIKCKKCGFENQLENLFCRNCGEKINMDDFDPKKANRMAFKDKLKRNLKKLGKIFCIFAAVIAVFGLISVLSLQVDEYQKPDTRKKLILKNKWDIMKKGMMVKYDPEDLSILFHLLYFPEIKERKSNKKSEPKKDDEEMIKSANSAKILTQTVTSFFPGKNDSKASPKKKSKYEKEKMMFFVEHAEFILNKENMSVILYTKMYDTVPAMLRITGVPKLSDGKIKFNIDSMRIGVVPVTLFSGFFTDKLSYLWKNPELQNTMKYLENIELDDNKIMLKGKVVKEE